MKTPFLVAIAAGCLFLGVIGYAQWPTRNIPPIDPVTFSPVKKTMRAFRSDWELAAYFRELAKRQKVAARLEVQANQASGIAGVASNDAPATAEKSVVSKAKDESITNTQEANVDEGGIVKLHGDHLVILRRGRLFTVRVGDDTLQPVSAVDAFGSEIDPSSTWYDEMLVSEDTVAVIGYSYQRGGTEVGLFSINDDGRLAYRSTYHLRSNDYYSSRNYASRLIGNKLIFYTPLYLSVGSDDPFAEFPAVRKWHRGAKPDEFRRIVAATNIYRPEHEFAESYGTALHTVTVCDLSNGGFDCKATGVLGPNGRVFYVSENAVYVWVSEWAQREKGSKSDAMVFRLPLDGSGPSALGVSGSPVDQFSFLESDDEHLNVLVRSDSSGDGMWHAEGSAGDVALMRVPVADFSDGRDVVQSSQYHELPKPVGYTFQNRFVGGHLLYGTGSGWGDPEARNRSSLFVVDWHDGEWQRLLLTHGVDRIEQMGEHAVVVGTDGQNLHFTAIRLDESPSIADSFVRKDASQGELRSQGFFYKPSGPNSGTLGLPISVPARPGYHHLFETSAAILFLHNEDLHFEQVGELAARSDRAVDDACRASCVDWYGNARPLFFQGRVLALLGYEIVEGAINEGHMRELRRVNYAPARVAITRGTGY